MDRRLLASLRPSLLASLLAGAAACSAARADQVAVPGAPPGTAIAIGIAPAKVRAPYDVQVMRESGETLPTYASKDRFYVQGNANERYIIRVTNPTARRVEAVVTVDGLDVIDGESGDLRKRGYVVPAYGEVRVEGFRTSTSDVATFRFSAVDDSYAGKKGKARNVGVIAVAIFEEVAPEPEQQIIVGPTTPPPPPGYRPPYDYRDDLSKADKAPASPTSPTIDPGSRSGSESTTVLGRVDSKNMPRPSKDYDGRLGGDRGGADRVAAKKKAPSTSYRPPMPSPTGGTGGAAQRRYEEAPDDEAEYGPPPAEAPRTNRPGLGTEFGETRYSAASYTRFVRNANRPIAVAELRYNDAAGLLALGINVGPLPDAGEVMTRETADPFPGDGRFATRPR